MRNIYRLTEEQYDKMWEEGKFYFEKEDGENFLCNEDLGDAWGGENWTDDQCIAEMEKSIEFLPSEEDLRMIQAWEDTKKEIDQWLKSQIE